MDINSRLKELKTQAPQVGMWDWVAEQVNQEYGIKLSANAARCRYDRAVKQGDNKFVSDTKRTNDYGRRIEFMAERVLVIPDTHLPFEHPGYLSWVSGLCYDYQIDTVIHIGDVLDHYGISSYIHDPDGLSGGDELKTVKERVKEWVELFPNLKICLGNHDTRHFAAAIKAGLSSAYLRHMNDLLDTPDTWEWNWSYKQVGGMIVNYEHGTGQAGASAAVNMAKAYGESVIIGHTHINPGVTWLSNGRDDYYGMNVGSAIDETAYAFAYSQGKPYRGTLGAGIVLDNGRLPFFVRFAGSN